MTEHSYDIAIIGAGIVGASIAYHLAKRGCTNVVVVEKEINPGMGSTSKAAGGIRAQFNSRINVELSQMSISAFERFPQEMGVDVVFNQVGYLWIATRPEDLRLFERNVADQRKLGLDVQLLDREGVRRKAPYVRMDDVLGGTFHQKDGYAPPADYVMGYCKRAKEMGVRILLGTAVTGLIVQNGAVAGVRTAAGEIHAERVVCSAGAYSGKIGEMIGVEIPVQPVRRQCFVTEPIRELPHPIPMTVDYTTGVYMHSESGGVLIGLADKDEPPSFNENIDWSFVEKVAELAMRRVPILEQAQVRTGWAGLYEVTPDHHPIIGDLPGVKGFTLATGFSGHGVMHAPATGQLVAELLTTGRTSLDLRPLRWSRFREGDLIKETHVI
ncbi:MAG: FAD-binding oxidoreductase [Planctomycetes bacterium]|nr:FAD-binding oxidoreductase [Planctomycetota bacterium]